MKDKSPYETPKILFYLLGGMDIITASGNEEEEKEENEIPEDVGENDGEWMAYEW